MCDNDNLEAIQRRLYDYFHTLHTMSGDIQVCIEPDAFNVRHCILTIIYTSIIIMSISTGIKSVEPVTGLLESVNVKYNDL